MKQPKITTKLILFIILIIAILASKRIVKGEVQTIKAERSKTNK